MDNSVLTLTVDINDAPLNEKADRIDKRISSLKEKSQEIFSDSSTTALPGFNQGMESQRGNWAKSLDDVERSYRAIDRTNNSFERSQAEANYKRKVEVANNVSRDLLNSQNIAQSLLGDLTKELVPIFSDGLKGVFGKVTIGLKTAAEQLGTQMSDEAIIDKFMASEDYSKIQKSLQSSHARGGEVFSAARMRQYFQSQMPFAVPQSYRQAIVGGSAVQIPKKAESFRGLLPSTFQSIPTSIPTKARSIGSSDDGRILLSEAEREKLSAAILKDRYLAEAAVSAGIVAKRNREYILNPDANRDMARAMGGFVMSGITRGAAGERKYGITNVEDPAFWNSISRKVGNNRTLDRNLSAAYTLTDIFGAGYTPAYFETPEKYDPSKKPGQTIGRIPKLEAIKPTRPYAEYNLDMMDAGVQISGSHPVVRMPDGKWQQLPTVMGPMGRNNQKNPLRNRAISPDDWHTVSLNNGMLQEIVSLANPAHLSQAGQNAFDDNMIYLKYDEKLSDPTLKTKEAEDYRKRLEYYYKNGYNANGHHYISTRIGKTHAEFMRDDIVDDLGRVQLGLPWDAPASDEIRRAGLELLANEGGIGRYGEIKPFSKALYNQNLLATEGENLRSMIGANFGFTPNETTKRMLAVSGLSDNGKRRIMEQHGTPNMKVAVSDFGALMDGMNWMAAEIAGEGFQGRAYGDKGTFGSIELQTLRKIYPQLLHGNATTEELIRQAGSSITEAQKSQILQEHGDFIIPGAGLNGTDLVLSPDVKIVEDRKNIKNFDERYGGMSQEEINDARSREINRFGVTAKTTYDDANTSSRWLSHQLINASMNEGFRDPRVVEYFDKVFFDEINRLRTDDQYARDVLFNGDQSVDLSLATNRAKIENHINGMKKQYGDGDRLLPAGTFRYNMAASNPFDVMNEMLVKAGVELTPEQQALSLDEKSAFLIDSPEKLLQVMRFPTTSSGNIQLQNKAASNEGFMGTRSLGAFARQAFRDAKLDPKAIYLKPGTRTLEDLQSMDFDGDQNGTMGLSGVANPELAAIMRIVGSANSREQMLKDAGQTFESQQQRKRNLTHKPKDKAEGYEITGEKEKADYTMNSQRSGYLMGSAERSQEIAAFYGGNDPEHRRKIAQAGLDLESKYDVVSTNLKSREEFQDTDEIKYLTSLGRAFSRIFDIAHDSVQTIGTNENSQLAWNKTSQDLFNEKNIDSINMPTVYHGDLIGLLRSRMKSKLLGENPDGVQIDEKGVAQEIYPWDEIFKQLPSIQNPESEAGKFQQMLRNVRKGFLKSDFLVAGDETVTALDQQYAKAQAEIIKEVDEMGLPESEMAAEINKRLSDIGGTVFTNFKKFGLTSENIRNNPNVQQVVEGLATEMKIPRSQLYSTLDQIQATQIETPQQQVNPATTKPKAVITEGKPGTKVPPIESTTKSSQPKVEARAEEYIQSEKPEEEARRLLESVLSVHKRDERINTLLAPENRDALLRAISSENIAPLFALKGIGKTTAEQAIQALKGSRITSIQKGGAASGLVSSVNVEDLIEETRENDVKPVKKQTESVDVSGAVKEFSARNEFDSELAKVVDFTSRLASKDRKRTQEEAPSQWDFGEYFVSNQNRNATKQRMAGLGVSPELLKTYDQEMDKAREQYYSSLRLASSGDLQDYMYSIDEMLQSRGVSGGIKDRVSQVDKIEADFDKASAAYEKLLHKENKTDEDHEALKQAQEMYESAEETKNTLIDEIINEATTEVSNQIEDLSLFSKGKTATPQDKVSKQIRDFDKKKETLQKNIDFLYDKNAISEDQYKELTASLGSVSTEDYRKVVETQAREATSLANQQSDVRYKQLLRQGNQLKRQRYGNGNDFISRALQQRDSRLASWENYQTQIKAELGKERTKFAGMHEGDEGYSETANKIKELEAASASASEAVQQLTNPMSTASAVATQFGDAIGKLATRLGRQLFQKALQETKRFVQEYDASMTEIQMITLKSDDEISSLGDNLIQSALDMRVNVSDVTSAASNLYRQGLSDEEVDTRMEDVIKFSKVANIKSEEASKIITTAMQNELVDNSGEAMDALVALGDIAATTASDIAKGMQKSAAAANEAGVSYQELVTLLTIGTSKTQLGGSSVGTALNTLFYRLYKVGEGEDVIDENGNHISSTAVSRALERAGVSVYGEGGQFRGAYDILTELGSKWNTLDDTDQSLILSQLGAGRQRNNVATILQGLAEDNGELAKRYLSTASNSEGITDKKYEIQMESLAAKMSEVRTSWDQLVASLNLGDVGGGFLSFVSSTIQGLNKASEATQGWALKLPLLIGGLTALSALLSASNPVFLVLAGLAAAVVAVGQLQQLLSGGTNAGVDLANEANIAYRKESINTAKTNLEKASRIYKSSKDGELSSADLDAINKLLDGVSTTLSDSFSQAELAALGLTGSFENVSDRLDAYAAALAKKEGQQQAENFEKRFVTDDTEKLTTLLSSDYGKQYTEEQKKFSDYLFNEYADVNGYLSFSNKDTQDGFEQQIRDSFGIGGIVSGSILDVYEDQIKEWIKTGQFIEGYARDESGKYTALPYRNLDDFYNSLQYAPYTDENGALTQAGSNVETLFKLIAGGSSSGYEKNVVAQTNYLEGAIKGFYEDRLTQELSSYDFIDKEFASTISSAFVDVIMNSISGAITSSAAGEEVDFPELISSNAQKYLMDMAGFFTAEDPVKAFQDFVIGSKQNDEDYILANGLENYTQEEQREAIRSLLFPTSPSVSGEPEVSTASSFLSSVLAGADAYRTADKNAPGYSADRIYEQLQGINSFEDLINGIQSGQITGMEAFLKQDATDIANWLAGYITEGENGLELTESANDQAWKIFRSKVAGKSANYADAEKASRIEIADAALATLNEYFNADEETTLGTNVTDYEALKGIIGDRYAGILAAGSNSEELLSEEDIAYMQMLIDNYRLGIESTPQQRNLALGQAQQAIQNGNLTSLLASGRGDWITSAMSGMEDSSTYLAAVQALEAKRAETGKALTAEERAEVLEAYGGEEAFQIMENNFERFKQNAEVEIHIKNLQSLEEAGKLAAGTAENFQKLRQGGTVALEVITKLTTEGYQSGQQAAMLYNGTPMEQAQAAMAYLDMGADQFYADNGAHVQDYIAQARSYQQQNQTKDASAWWEEYNAAQTEPEKQRIIAAAKSAGYITTEDQLADINGFKFDQDVLNVNRVSSFAGQEATQKALDTTANLLALINETFEGTATEQRNAEGIANEATRRYLTNRANVAAGTYTWQEGEEEAQRREALRETTIQSLQAQESEGLIKQGTAQLYEQLTSPIAETVEQAKQGLVNQITTFQRESSVFEAMQGLTPEQWALNGAAYAEELGGLLGWSDQEKQFYSKEENFSTVEEIMAKRGEDFSKGLETLLEQMFDFDLSDFEGLENITDTLSAFSEEDGNEAAAVLLSVFETLSQIAGLEWDGSKFTTGDSTTVSDVTNQYTTEYQRQQADREILSSLNGYVREGMTLDQFGAGLIGTDEGQPFRTVADYKNFIDRTGIGSILGQVGNEGFTAADVNRLRQATPQGSLYRDTNYRTQYNKFNELRNADGTFDMAGLKSAMNDPDFNNWISQFTHLQTALDEVRETSSTTGTEFGYLSDEIEHGLLEAEDAFGSKTKDVVGAMDNATGSAQKQSNALKQLRSSMTAVSNNEYYRKQFTEKNVRTGKTSEYLQGLGFTKDQITGGKFDDQIKAAIELDRSADFEALSEDLQANFGTVTQEFKDYVADNPIEIDGLQVGVDSGSVTVSTEELISNFGSALSDTQNKLLQLVLASGLEVNWQVDWNDDQTLITPVVNSVAGSKPSGGGGGGKSAAQKAIDDAKNDVTLAEHYSNMAEKMYTHYETFGDSRGMMSTLEDRRIALEGESGVIKNNIADLEAELAKTSEGTDDWQALKEAINSAYESLVDVQNEMEDISNQKVQVIVEKYEIQGKETEHQYNMVGTEMEMALLDGDYDKYSELAAQKEELINAQIENNTSELQELYAARAEQEAQYGKATQDTIDQIYALEEEKLNKELELRQFQNEVADQEIANEEKKNSAESAQAESEASTAGAYASYYKRAGNHEAYRNQILAQNAAYAKQIQIQKALLAIIQAKAEAELLQNGYTEQYYEYLIRIYEIQSTIAGLEANIANNLLDIEQDYVDEMLENYKREVEVFDHYENLLNSRKKMYENAGADEAYDIMREKERGLIESELEGNRSYLEQMKSLLANTTYNSDAWWTLRDKIWDVKEAIAEAETELENWNRENEKIKIDRWFEDWGREQDERDHNLKIAQYEQTRTKNAGEYTNYGILLEYENDMRQKNIDILKDQIAILQEELKNENIGEEDYYRVAKAIREKSQAIYNDTKEIEKNTKALAENRETIRKTQMTLQNMVLEVIKDNKQREEDMLSARIRMEGYILEAIKARYTEEWKFISETYEKQRDALNKEKQLINERLNYRKQAAEQEDQYEQLRAFEQQYALISADPTRSKEANELSRQIADLREDISWTRASEEAAYATERIDQELQAIEDFLTIGQERLNEMLENANNFATEVNEIMGRSMTEIVAWLQENNEMYKNSLADSQIQMVETWEQTWKDMMGITDTYWDEIAQITSDKTTFINYMIENSIDYLNASLEGQTSYVYQWETAYDNAVAAVTDNLNSVSNAYDQLYEHTAAYYSALWDMYAETARAYEAMYNDIDNLGKQSASLGGNDDSTQQQQQATNADGSVKNGWEKVGDKWYYWENGVEAKGWRNINDEYGDVWYAFDQTTGEMLTGKQYLGADFTDQNGQSWEGTYYFNTANDAFMEGAMVAEDKEVQSGRSWIQNGDGTWNYYDDTGAMVTDQWVNDDYYGDNYVDEEGVWDPNKKKKYATGGLVDYTGLAQVDGTPTRPESFLDATDTELLRTLIDAFDYVTVPSMHASLDEISGSATGAPSVGEINITLNEAKLESDADYEEVAQKVGRAFTKELTSKGFNLANYSF